MSCAVPLRRLLAGLWLAFGLIVGVPATAQSLPDWQHTSVNDFAGVLRSEDARILDEALIALNHATGVEGTVVTLPDRARYGGTDGLEPFATRLFNHWGVGNAQRNDGFMVLVIPGTHEARIELGKGYPGSTDAVAAGIMRAEMLPAFRDGDYSRGIRQGTLAVIDRIARPMAAEGKVRPPRRSGDLAGLGLFLAAVAAMFGLARWNRSRADRCPQCRHRGLEREATPVREGLPGGGWRTAQQTVALRCPACGWTGSRVTPLPVISTYGPAGQLLTRDNRDRPRGGSGGFGGGSSGGGGASGRW